MVVVVVMVMVVVMAGGSGRPQLVKSLLAGTLGLEESKIKELKKRVCLHFILIILS